MSKKQYVAISIILLMLMLCSTLTATMPAVKAYDYDYGYASNLYTTNWMDWNGNAEHTWTAFTQIANLFSQKSLWVIYYGYPYYYGPAYGEVTNWGSSATPYTVYNRIEHVNVYHPDFSTVLYVGHGGPQGFYVHTDYPDNPNIFPPLVSFAEIQARTQSSPTHQFVLMWVCNGGNNAPQGSPTAWNPLWWSYPPAYPPYTWVGFNDASPWLCDQMSPGNIFRYWLVFFYYYALNGDYSVMDALNLASVATGFQDFGSSVLGGSGRYWTYYPYNHPPYYNQSGWWTGRMNVCGNPFGTYLPKDVYIYYP